MDALQVDAGNCQQQLYSRPLAKRMKQKTIRVTKKHGAGDKREQWGE